MTGMFLLQKNKSMVLCYGLFLSLFFLGSNQVSSAEFEVYEAFNQLSILQNKLDNQTLNSREIKDIRETALSLRAESLECKSETKPQLELLNRKIKIMEATSPEDEIGIYENLRNAREERSQINVMFINCSLSAEESTQVIDVSNKLLNEFTTEFLSESGINIIQAFGAFPDQFKLLPSLLFDETID